MIHGRDESLFGGDRSSKVQKFGLARPKLAGVRKLDSTIVDEFSHVSATRLKSRRLTSIFRRLSSTIERREKTIKRLLKCSNSPKMGQSRRKWAGAFVIDSLFGKWSTLLVD
jgi:hypothetical protein